MNGVSKILNKITSKPFQYVERPVHAGYVSAFLGFRGSLHMSSIRAIMLHAECRNNQPSQRMQDKHGASCSTIPR